MGGGANGDAGDDRMLDAEEPERRGQKDRAHDAGKDNGERGDCRQAAHGLAQRHPDGRGHRFRQQREDHLAVQPEELPKQVYAADAGGRTRQRTDKDGKQVFFEHLQLAVDREGERNGGRGQAQGQKPAALVVFVKRHAEKD